MGRVKLNRTFLRLRVDPSTPDKLKQMALKLGFQWGDNGNTGVFLDKLSNLPIDKIRKLFDENHTKLD